MRISILLALLFFAASTALAHCDSLSGPVVEAARQAVKTADATPVLRWVEPRFESDIRDALARTIAVRRSGPDAARLADQWFFETVVRLHREGEGEPFTGLKNEPVEPALALADAAISAGSLSKLTSAVSADVTSALTSAFNEVLETKKQANESVEGGRRHVAAYVHFMHLVESLHAALGEKH